MATEIKKNDTTKEKLIILLAKYIKECSKKLNEKTSSINVPIVHDSWYSGRGNDRTFLYTNIYFGDKNYKFYDKEITDRDFLVIVQTALKESKCNGKVKTKEWEEDIFHGRWYSHIKHIKFDGLTLFGKPCKEFVTLSRMLKKYTNKELGETDVNSSSVCGKRSSWSADENSTGFLCYQPKKCQRAIDFIREKRTSKDKLYFEVKNILEHEDEYEYKIAQYQESEWYATEYNYLELRVTTPKGKTKGILDVRARVKNW